MRRFDINVDDIGWRVCSSNTIGEIKEAHCKRLNVDPQTVVLRFQNQVLEDKKSVGFYDLKHDSKLTTELITTTPEVRIHLNLPDNTEVSLTVSLNATVHEIREKLQPWIGEKKVVLIFEGRVLEDRHHLTDYGIGENDRIRVVRAIEPEPSTESAIGKSVKGVHLSNRPQQSSTTTNEAPLEIEVHFHDGERLFPVMLQTNCPVDYAIWVLKHSSKLRGRQFRLSRDGVVLDNAKSLDHYGINDGSHVDIC
ncbi:unnamed protein product [Mesocestoides corti]|uniref:Ubiquitin-like domain-containing protein n=1 Tax=Mesocestoides corti TaxID=53468 RepID=A0A0R3U914_MESCO|nr:unnamed protein product [Mesocestoides corti]